MFSGCGFLARTCWLRAGSRISNRGVLRATPTRGNCIVRFYCFSHCPFCMTTTVQPRTTGSEVKSSTSGLESQIYYQSQKGVITPITPSPEVKRLGGGGGGGGGGGVFIEFLTKEGCAPPAPPPPPPPPDPALLAACCLTTGLTYFPPLPSYASLISPPFIVPSVPQILPARNALILLTGRTLELTCLDMEGEPFPTFLWRREHSRLQQSDGESLCSKISISLVN